MASISSMTGLDRAAWDAISDDEVIQRVRAGETALYEILMRRYNLRVYRVARSILGDDAEAEDVMQEAYVRAYQNLRQFAGRAKFSTWLTKIAVYEALGRIRRRGRDEDLESLSESSLHTMTKVTADKPDPERQTYDRELKMVMEGAIDALPLGYRSVFVLRAVEGLSVAETAACLDVGDETVKTRFHRARAFLRKELHQRAGIVAADVFPFHLSRCDRVVKAVLQRIGELGSDTPQTRD
jgi:RNA polymerase sigma-70 factor (ECF subfamily)